MHKTLKILIFDLILKCERNINCFMRILLAAQCTHHIWIDRCVDKGSIAISIYLSILIVFYVCKQFNHSSNCKFNYCICANFICHPILWAQSFVLSTLSEFFAIYRHTLNMSEFEESKKRQHRICSKRFIVCRVHNSSTKINSIFWKMH